jgi:hypothetical protein
MGGKRRQIKIQSANLSPATGGEVRLFHDFLQSVLLKAAAAKIEISCQRCDEKQREESG